MSAINSKPMFDAKGWRLTEQERELTTLARDFGQTTLAGRAHLWDTEATFPLENYHDMHGNGLLSIGVPKEHGGLGADYRAYMLTAAEMGRFCGATALTWNMHVCSTLWTGPLSDDLDLEPDALTEHHDRRSEHFRRIVEDGAIYSQPFSEGGAAAAGAAPWSTTATPTEGGWIINGKKIFASLSGFADYYGILCGEIQESGKYSRRDTIYIAVPAKAEGVKVEGEWDPLGMRGTVSRTLIFEDVFVPDSAALMPHGLYFQAASRWPHMFMTLSPTYMGICQAAYDFTIAYLRGEIEGVPPVKRRQFPTKQLAVADMNVKLESAKALWFQAISEACPDPTKEQLMRAYTAQHVVMETAASLCALAIRTCGGQSMLKSLPLERLYRDSRCGSLMLPWTAEICLDRLGKLALYETGESDDG